MSTKHTIIAALAAVAVVVGVALVATAGSGNDPSAIRSFTAADSGSRVELEVGESITVALVGNPTTGYAWQTGDLDPAVLATGEPAYQAGSDLIGAGGTYTFTFTAVGTGEVEVLMEYARPWEQVEPLETFTLHVTVS